MSAVKFFLTAVALLATHAHAVDKAVNPDLNQKLKNSPTNLERSNTLGTDDAWTFKFDDQPNYTFTPGSVVNANAATFPALTGVGMTLAMLNLGPCAMLPPHFHPRATNLVVAVKGRTDTFMFGENGAKTVKTELTPGKMTIFPTGSVHMMANMECEDAQLVSALNSDDTGTTNLFTAAWALPPEYLQPALGDYHVDTKSLGANVPPPGTGSISGEAECRKRCGIPADENAKKDGPKGRFTKRQEE